MGNTAPHSLHLEIDAEVPMAAVGTRLDVWVAAALGVSRSRVQGLIADGRVAVDGRPARPSEKLRGGERIVATGPPLVQVALVAQALPLRVLFEDDDLLVIDKAAGMAVHPGAGIPDGTVANAVLHRCPGIHIGGELRPGIVHRLDKDTSGVLVVCKTDAALSALARAFAERRVHKRYTAFCLGRPRADRFELVTGHRRADRDRRRFTTKIPPPTRDGGAVRRAHSLIAVVSSAGGISQVDVQIFTGRTHQIRAHLADIGHPLLQDELYGGGRAERRLRPSLVRDAVASLARQALHAHALAFEHPRTCAALRFEAPLPDDLAAIATALQSVTDHDGGRA